MARNIVYIQANEKIAQSFQDTFRERNIDLIIASSAQEALQIMAQQEVGLLLVDINIPDMRLSKLVEICTRDFPTVAMNVCVDVLNSLLVTKLVNRHAIHKIFVAPWDVKEMVEEIEESLDAAEIGREQILHENRILKENEELQETIKTLTEALKKQQYSYNKLRALTDLFFRHAVNAHDAEDENAEAQLGEIKRIFDMYLRMQTTDKIDIDRFEDVLRSDLSKLKESMPGLSVGDLISCLIGGVPKVKAANIRFAVWFLAYYGCRTMGNCTVSVSSQFMTATRAMFEITLEGSQKNKVPFLEQYLTDTIYLLAETVEPKEEDGRISYRLEFPTVTGEQEA